MILRSLSSMEAVNFVIVSGEIVLQHSFIASFSSFLLKYCLPASYNLRLTIDQRFSIGLTSGDDGGHAKKSLVYLEACDMALSCILDAFELKGTRLILVQLKNFFFKNSTYASLSIFTPSSTKKGPIHVCPQMPAQNITPPPRCCRLSLKHEVPV